MPRIDTFIRLGGALDVMPSKLADGILWTPATAIVLPGAFEVSNDPVLAEEIAILRKVSRRGRMRPRNG